MRLACCFGLGHEPAAARPASPPAQLEGKPQAQAATAAAAAASSAASSHPPPVCVALEPAPAAAAPVHHSNAYLATPGGSARGLTASPNSAPNSGGPHATLLAETASSVRLNAAAEGLRALQVGPRGREMRREVRGTGWWMKEQSMPCRRCRCRRHWSDGGARRSGGGALPPPPAFPRTPSTVPCLQWGPPPRPHHVFWRPGVRHELPPGDPPPRTHPLDVLPHPVAAAQRSVLLQSQLAQLQGHWWSRLQLSLELIAKHYSAACVRCACMAYPAG